MSDCIFCKILKGEIPNHTVYEDKDVLAFLDIHPHAKGHTVVIPKVHADNLNDLADDQVNNLFLGVKKTTEIIQTVLHPEGYNIGWNHNAVAGQVVPHLHIHIMPRWSGDNGGNMHVIVNNPGKEAVEEVAQLFAKRY